MRTPGSWTSRLLSASEINAWLLAVPRIDRDCRLYSYCRQMKSFWLSSSHEGTALEAREVAVPEPAAGQILVRMHAAGLNRGELMVRRDLHGKAGPARPAGNEGAGEVAGLGSGVSDFRTGDRVMGV